MANMMRSEIKSLTGLRGLAAFWVMLGHYGMDRWSGNATMRAFGAHSYIAVDIFMVLSGFVLAMIYQHDFGPASPPSNYRRFLKLRLIRIYPLYLLTTTICVAVMWLDFGFTRCVPCGANITANVLMVHGWLWSVGSYNGPGWSLSVEWLLNLVFPIFVLLLLRASPRRSALLMLAALVGLGLMALLEGQTNYFGFDQVGAINWYDSPISVLRCSVSFMLGVYAWRLRCSAPWAAVLGRTPVLAMIASGLIIASVLPSLDVLFVLLSCALVIGCSYERSWIAKALATPALHWLGLISYSLYMWHMTLLWVRTVVIRVVTGDQIFGPQNLPTFLDAAVCVVIALVISKFSYDYFERPSQRWLRSLQASPKAMPAV